MYRVRPYRLRLRSPLMLAGGRRLEFREGLLVQDLETGGWGDAAPLPSFSPETLAQVRAAAARGDREAAGLPSLRFALACAARGLSEVQPPVSVNALWLPGSESVAELLSRIADWEDPVVKVKLNRPEAVQLLHDALAHRAELRFRVDANRQWREPDLLAAWEAAPQAALDYFEEPLTDPRGYERIWRTAPVPVALDESLLEPQGSTLAQAPQVKAVVIKPTLLGAPSDWAAWGRYACPVISSAFESAVGLWHLATLCPPGVACGLDTGRVFEADVAEPRPLPERGLLQRKVPLKYPCA